MLALGMLGFGGGKAGIGGGGFGGAVFFLEGPATGPFQPLDICALIPECVPNPRTS